MPHRRLFRLAEECKICFRVDNSRSPAHLAGLSVQGTEQNRISIPSVSQRLTGLLVAWRKGLLRLNRNPLFSTRDPQFGTIRSTVMRRAIELRGGKHQALPNKI